MSRFTGTVQDVARETGYSQSSIRRKSADPNDDFPAPYRLSPRAVRWDLDEVRDWIRSRPRVVEKSKTKPFRCDQPINWY